MIGGPGGIAMADSSGHTGARARTRYRVGEFVAGQRNTYPILLEVIRMEDDGLLRVRGVDWAPGYSSLVTSEQVRPVADILHTTVTRG